MLATIAVLWSAESERLLGQGVVVAIIGGLTAIITVYIQLRTTRKNNADHGAVALQLKALGEEVAAVRVEMLGDIHDLKSDVRSLKNEVSEERRMITNLDTRLESLEKLTPPATNVHVHTTPSGRVVQEDPT